jgi:hypothetical protein
MLVSVWPQSPTYYQYNVVCNGIYTAIDLRKINVSLVVSSSRSFPHSWLITRFVTRLTRRIQLVEQELPTLPEHMSSPLVFSGVRVIRSLVLHRYSITVNQVMIVTVKLSKWWLPINQCEHLFHELPYWQQPSMVEILICTTRFGISSLRKFYGHNHDLIDRYRISVSQMTTDMFHLL